MKLKRQIIMMMIHKLKKNLIIMKWKKIQMKFEQKKIKWNQKNKNLFWKIQILIYNKTQKKI